MKEETIKKFFERYQQFFTRSLAGNFDADEFSALYSNELISASPFGVRDAKNDEEIHKAMESGYEYYRKIGTKEMRLGKIRISPIDNLHCIAHVGWTSVHTKENAPDSEIDFEVHYIIQQLKDEPKVFGWISGDEQELLKKHGIGGGHDD